MVECLRTWRRLNAVHNEIERIGARNIQNGGGHGHLEHGLSLTEEVEFTKADRRHQIVRDLNPILDKLTPFSIENFLRGNLIEM